MIARIEHHKVVALTALAAALCVLVLATLFVALRPVETTLPGASSGVSMLGNRAKDIHGSLGLAAKGMSEGTANRANLARNLMIKRHLELVAREHQSPKHKDS